MNTKSGIETRVSLFMPPKVRCTIRSNTRFSNQGCEGFQKARYPNPIPRPISVKAVGNPIMIAVTISPSIVSPRMGSLILFILLKVAVRGATSSIERASPKPRRVASSWMVWALPMASRRDSSSTSSLCASCVSMTSISSTSFSRSGQAPVRRQTIQRKISARPWIITNVPAIGMMALNW
jgi:hypothetical protein